MARSTLHPESESLSSEWKGGKIVGSMAQVEASRLQLYGGGAAELHVHGRDFQVPREGEAELRRREPRGGGLEQQGDPGAGDPVVRPGDTDVEEEVAQPGAGYAAERGLERVEWDVVEGDRDLGDAGPEAAPPAGENGRARGDGDEAF